jgi:hypothetical protein
MGTRANRLRNIAVAGLLCLALPACGSGTKQNDYWDQFKNLTGFVPRDSDPYPNEEYFPLGNAIRILFNEGIDPTSIAGAVKVMKGTTATDITSSGTLSVTTTQIAADTLVFTPNGPLVANTIYQVSVSAALRSTSGRNLAVPVFIRFSTGSLDYSYGGLSVEGAPQAVSWQIQRYSLTGNCLSAQVTFNEDLLDAPMGNYEAKGWLSGVFGPIETGMIFGYQPYANNWRLWQLEFGSWSGMCDPALYGLGVELKVDLNYVRDLQNEYGRAGHTFKGF